MITKRKFEIEGDGVNNAFTFDCLGIPVGAIFTLYNEDSTLVSATGFSYTRWIDKVVFVFGSAPTTKILVLVQY